MIEFLCCPRSFDRETFGRLSWRVQVRVHADDGVHRGHER